MTPSRAGASRRHARVTAPAAGAADDGETRRSARITQHGDPEPHPSRDEPHGSRWPSRMRIHRMAIDATARTAASSVSSPRGPGRRADGGGQQVGEMVTDDDARERREEQPLRRVAAAPMRCAAQKARSRRRADLWKEQPQLATSSCGRRPPAAWRDDGGQRQAPVRPRATPMKTNSPTPSWVSASAMPANGEERGERVVRGRGLVAYRPARDWSVRHRVPRRDSKNTGR